MSDIINQFHKKHRLDMRTSFGLYREPIQRITCNDGFSISVQAGAYSYCAPRVTQDVEYTSFEVGFPSEPVPELLEWRDGDKEDVGNVFGYVPVDVIVGLIERHGGIKAEQP